MGILRVMSKNGDDRYTWKHEQFQASSSEDLDPVAAVQAAEEITKARRAQLAFEQGVGKGATAFSIDDDGKPTRLEHFDPRVKQIVLVPRVVGV